MDKNLYTQEKGNKHGACPVGEVADGEISLRELFLVLWASKWLVIIITTVFSFASVVCAINLPNIYKSEVLLSPTEQKQSGGLAGLAGQFGGLASLAGVNIGDNSSNKARLAVEILKSRQFIFEFIEKHNILPELMSAESWDLQTNELVYDDEVFNHVTKEWVRKVNAPFTPEPSLQEAYKEFKKIITIVEEKETGLYMISIEHVSPFIAKQWVDWLVIDINETMKKRDVIEATKSTEFLTAQLEKTQIVDIQAVLYKLIEEQTKTIMFAKVRDEYIFKTIDPALIPEEKFEPKRALLAILGTVLGGFFSVLLVLVRYFTNKVKK